ncbi:hypothetical protein [Spiroplasma platyhelix]|uniref:Uncharacterized protein n=1 Tax=Spiroplasma platyhelix PALS-1 TaxID=1276218 RepID=A0A846TSC3_9MOLU|nr:hypothetical protein [Spiroplasma platyhelix]MBE4704034.1 hypothetical protein [Spiroplasma platyhelix PALS-1]NKE38405.1 hypothetical protein [Spiroplasma platyhelix PALS-1]UJB29292.1 hypothetical protein SPLAT_v1c05280 [Spiroplasma platyhelix PALS-1]
MKLIFTRKQEEQKKKIINNVQTDLLYKLVINYLDLKLKDKNQVENKYIINQFDSLEKILDIIDEVNNDKLNQIEANNKISNIGFPSDFKEMSKFLEQKPYYKPIFDIYVLFIGLSVNEEVKNLCFVELYDYYEKENRKNIKHKKQNTNTNSLIKKLIKQTNNILNLNDIGKYKKAYY